MIELLYHFLPAGHPDATDSTSQLSRDAAPIRMSLPLGRLPTGIGPADNLLLSHRAKRRQTRIDIAPFLGVNKVLRARQEGALTKTVARAGRRIIIELSRKSGYHAGRDIFSIVRINEAEQDEVAKQ